MKSPIKALVEELDPGRHQLLPIKLTSLLNEPFGEEQWWMLNAHQTQSTIIDDMTDCHPLQGAEETHHLMSLNPRGRITLDERKLRAGLNLWRESRYPMTLFASDAFFAALTERGIKPEFREVEMVTL